MSTPPACHSPVSRREYRTLADSQVSARAAALHAREVARTNREEQLVKADATETQARAVETDAKARYHEAEDEVRRKVDTAPGRES